MSITTGINMDVQSYCEGLADRALAASRSLMTLSGAERNAVLQTLADRLNSARSLIQQANQRDLDHAPAFGLSEAMIDRLRMTDDRIQSMSDSVRQIANQMDPVGQVIDGYVRPNGLSIQKIRVPIGVVLIIFESRPNVTCDAAALCLKSGNAVILRGGKEAIHTNTAIATIVRESLQQHGVATDAVQLVETTDRAAVGCLLQMDDRIDLAIPRGGESLIRAVVEQARIPVIKHYTGNCHIYVDAGARHLPMGMVREIVVNAKTQRTGVCNATEKLLVHADVADLLVESARALAAAGVEIRGCPRTMETLAGHVADAQLKAADASDWSAEYLDLILAVKIVDSLDEAVAHINRYGSRHTDAILSGDTLACDRFAMMVDSADIMMNCSTRFSDGGEYGLGAEIGISTDKLHARGPMGALDLTTYKWIVRGSGQIRE